MLLSRLRAPRALRSRHAAHLGAVDSRGQPLLLLSLCEGRKSFAAHKSVGGTRSLKLPYTPDLVAVLRKVVHEQHAVRLRALSELRAPTAMHPGCEAKRM